MNKDFVKQIIENEGYTVNYQQTDKGNAIVVGRPGLNITPVIYYDQFDESLKDAEIAVRIMEIADANMPKEDFNIDNIMNWEAVKDNLRLCLRRNGFDSAVTEPFHGMQKYVRIVISDAPGTEEDSFASIVVTKDVLNVLEVTQEMLFEQALECTRKDYKIFDMRTMLAAMMPDMEIPPMDAGMTVLSTEDKIHGASIICDNEKLKETAELLGGSFYILPSSIHEILAVPASIADFNGQSLKAMVREVNDTEVAENEVLSYSVYFYDAEVEEIFKAA